MMIIKKFWEDHKTAICVIGGTSVVITGLYFLLKHKRNIVDLTGQKVIHWMPENGSMNLEKVKEVLEANKNNSSQFAIFREGPNPAEYVTIVLSGDVITP